MTVGGAGLYAFPCSTEKACLYPLSGLWVTQTLLWQIFCIPSMDSCNQLAISPHQLFWVNWRGVHIMVYMGLGEEGRAQSNGWECIHLGLDSWGKSWIGCPIFMNFLPLFCFELPRPMGSLCLRCMVCKNWNQNKKHIYPPLNQQYVVGPHEQIRHLVKWI